MQILGSKGIMSVYNGSQQIRIYEAPFWRPDYDAPVRNVTAEAIAALPTDKRPTIDLQMAANVAIVRDVLKARGEEREPINSGRDGRWALEMIYGVYASHLSGKRVALPLTNRKHPLV